MVIYEIERLPCRIDYVGKEMYYLSFILSIGEWAQEGGVLGFSHKRGQTRMPVCTIPVHSSGGYTCPVYNSNVFTRHAKGLHDSEIPRGHSLVPVRG